ncbi:glutamate-5-semialdehyde dehydrogenase [Reichenbachiella versicolor]|uniref:glutamate-5-semialdehyde dehydrogenase n=1 Tax=Reichenbachiella versicolor TaxID=1821036 RepID=UPI000D6E5F87|nr:glutamate-5-semialdehyde dehydrogenase [Reichenbachiella versicolor]
MILTTEQKNQVLKDLASLIAGNSDDIIAQNKLDLDKAGDLDLTLVDRLKVDEKKVQGMVSAVEEVIDLEDPQGVVLSQYDHPNGMKVENRVVPFGKILIIYESRPDVTIEAAISAFKAGNKIMLKGGKEARNSNLFLVKLWKEALSKNGIAEDFVTYLDIDRTETQRLLADNPYNLDLIIPRGGDGLINYIRTNTAVPLIISGRGNNFIYVHENADLDKALNLILNGKSRLSVCNAIDKVLFNKNIAGLDEWMAKVITAAQAMELVIHGDGEYFSQFNNVTSMKEKSMYAEEFLSADILFGIVDTMDEAIVKINQYSGGHSGVIVSSDKESAVQFQNEVDCAAVYHNASSRFTDGGQFGFGAEIAISTQKLHFRGPVGLGQLVTNKWFISGDGQIR